MGDTDGVGGRWVIVFAYLVIKLEYPLINRDCI